MFGTLAADKGGQLDCAYTVNFVLEIYRIEIISHKMHSFGKTAERKKKTRNVIVDWKVHRTVTYITKLTLYCRSISSSVMLVNVLSYFML